jgi:hypothetical protein
MSKCLHFSHDQRTDSGHLGVFPLQFTHAPTILHWQVTPGRQRHVQRIKKPHLEVPFSHIGDDTITALTQLAEIFKNKSSKTKVARTYSFAYQGSRKKRPAALTQPMLTYPMRQKYRKRSQKPIHNTTTINMPLLPRVITPMTGQAASPRVPAPTQDLSPRNLSQDDFWSMGSANMAVALGTNHWYQRHFSNAVVHPITGKQMEYMALMNDPDLQPLWKRGFRNKAGRLFQGIRDIPGTKTCFFVKLKNIPKIIYGKFFSDYKPHKKEKERVRVTVGGDKLDYFGDVATSTADITKFKILINSTLSTKDAAMMMMDIINYYLGTPLPRYKYKRMLLSRFPVRNCEQIQP